MVTPITPDEVVEQLLNAIPDEVIQAVNEGIVKNWTGGKSITVTQQYIKDRAIELMGIEYSAFNNQWLDFEDIFRKVGWKVEYDKPAYYEDYDAFFRFTRT